MIIKNSSIILILILLCSCVQKHYNEWVEKQGSYFYYNERGEMIKGTDYFIGADRYFFDEKGKMLTDWYYSNNKKAYVYLGNDGKARKGWQKINEKWYYFGKSSGLMETDWQKIDGEWYYFDKKNGDLKTSTFIDDTYLVDENGKMIHSGWFNINGQMLYFENDGKINRSRNYEQEIRAQQNAANKQRNNSSSSDLPEFCYVYGAGSINAAFRECVKYHDSALAGNKMDVILLKGAVEKLESLVNVAKAMSFGSTVGTGRGISSELEKEFTLLNTVIVGWKGYISRNLY